jgi:hypothetical protein
VHPALSRRAALVAAAGAGLLLAGCASVDQPAVERVATAFEDTSGDPQARCDLLVPATLAALEQDQSKPCAEAIADVPLQGGTVHGVQIWGGDAQVRVGGDTVFLSRTSAGWKIAAAGCTPREQAPYDCDVEGP